MLKKLFAGPSLPLLFREGLGVGLLLFLCSTSLMAQGTMDPFPPVDDSEFQNNMIIIGQVRKGGEVLGDGTWVAAYSNGIIRGKSETTTEGSYTSCFQMTVCGNGSAPLVFKVYTDGEMVEVDQGLTFVSDAVLGSYGDFYYIDLPTAALGDANGDGTVNIADVTAIINKINGVPPATFDATAADVNKDGTINIADVTGVINIINQ